MQNPVPECNEPKQDSREFVSKIKTDSPGLWVYNYDFEFELGKRPKSSTRQAGFPLWYCLNRSAIILLPLTSARDSILVYEKPAEIILQALLNKLGYLPHFEVLEPIAETNSIYEDLKTDTRFLQYSSTKYRLIPWGWSPRAIALQKEHFRVGIFSQDEQLIARLNSKNYSCNLRETFLPVKSSIPAHNLVANDISEEKLKIILNQFYKLNNSFLVKHYFGTAGKLTDFCGSNNFSSSKVRKWKSWLKQGGGILLEKMMPVVREWSIQLEFKSDRKVSKIGLTRLFSGKDRSYLGTLLDNTSTNLTDEIFELFSPVWSEVCSCGYRGPLGIDLIETEDGQFKLLEINTRLTMGRIAFEWNKMINPFPIGFFTNLFLKKTKYCECGDFMAKCRDLESRCNCSLTLINFISVNEKSLFITVFLGVNIEDEIWELLNLLKQHLEA